MGVWIEGFVEVPLDGAWQFAGRMIPNILYSPDEPEEPERIPEPFFESDHKELAAILGGGYGTPYVQVCETRGLPPDPSPELAAWLGPRVGEKGFSTTWCLVRELLDFDWTGRIQRREAMVDPRAAHLFTGCPRGFPWKDWPQDVEVSYATWMRGGVTVEWEESYAQSAGDFYSEVLPRLRMQGPAGEIRVVLSFDW
jgi:hypothetical protein